MRFYVGDWNISPARTHCGNVERTVERIKFKLPKILHTELGKWDEVDEQLEQIVAQDGNILREYDASINKLDSNLREIKVLLEQEAFVVGKQKYYGLKKNLEADIRRLKSGVERMEQASNHINKIVG